MGVKKNLITKINATIYWPNLPFSIFAGEELPLNQANYSMPS